MLVKNFALMTCAFMALTGISEASSKCRKKQTHTETTTRQVANHDAPSGDEKTKGKNEGRKRYHRHKKTFRSGANLIFVDAATTVALVEQDGSKLKPFATLDQALARAQQKQSRKTHGRNRSVKIILKSGTYSPSGDKEAFEVQAPLSLTIVCRGEATIAKPITWIAKKTNA